MKSSTGTARLPEVNYRSCSLNRAESSVLEIKATAGLDTKGHKLLPDDQGH